MTKNYWIIVSCAALLLVASACFNSKDGPQAGGHTNWLKCQSLEDCEMSSQAVACSNGFCVDKAGERISVAVSDLPKDSTDGDDASVPTPLDPDTGAPALLFTSSDIGNVPTPGSSELSEDGVLTVCGSGLDDGNTVEIESYHFAHQTANQNLKEFTAMLESMGGVEPNGGALLVVTRRFSWNDTFGFFIPTPDEAYGLLPPEAYEAIGYNVEPISLPASFSIRKSEDGASMQLWVKSNGEEWKLSRSVSAELITDLASMDLGVGCSSGTDKLGCCVWRDIQIEKETKDPPEKCLPQFASMIQGQCDPQTFEATYWTGSYCNQVSGCECRGDDCGNGYSQDECAALQEECHDQVTDCGGFAFFTCPADYYCAYAGWGMCGATDASAICVKRPGPSDCDDTEQKVRGCDGETYLNPCRAAQAGTGVYEFLGEGN